MALSSNRLLEVFASRTESVEDAVTLLLGGTIAQPDIQPLLLAWSHCLSLLAFTCYLWHK